MANLLQLVNTYNDFKTKAAKPKPAQDKPGAATTPSPNVEDAIQPAAPGAQGPRTVAPP